MVMVFGEITTKASVDYEAVVRRVCKEIGFTSDDVGLDGDKCKVLVHIEEQSPEIGASVHGMNTKALEDIGAGDQGHMFGYATDETAELMPLTHVLATKIGYRCCFEFSMCHEHAPFWLQLCMQILTSLISLHDVACCKTCPQPAGLLKLARMETVLGSGQMAKHRLPLSM